MWSRSMRAGSFTPATQPCATSRIEPTFKRPSTPPCPESTWVSQRATRGAPSRSHPGCLGRRTSDSPRGGGSVMRRNDQNGAGSDPNHALPDIPEERACQVPVAAAAGDDEVCPVVPRPFGDRVGSAPAGRQDLVLGIQSGCAQVTDLHAHLVLEREIG